MFRVLFSSSRGCSWWGKKCVMLKLQGLSSRGFSASSTKYLQLHRNEVNFPGFLKIQSLPLLPVFAKRLFASYPVESAEETIVTNTPMYERQEGILFEAIPRSVCTEQNICKWLNLQGFQLEEDSILLMRSRLGRPTGKALALTTELPHRDYSLYFPKGTKHRVIDYHDVKIFVEQCERFLRLSDDLRWISRPEFFHRTVTITGIHSTYGRKELSEVLYQHSAVKIDPQNIIFFFNNDGTQSDIAVVVCESEKLSRRLIAHIQEVPIPLHYQYGSISGGGFIWSSRASLFLSDPQFDFQAYKRKYQVFISGWEEDLTEEEFVALLSELKIFPVKVKKCEIKAAKSKTTAFFMVFERMLDTKKIMYRLQTLKKRWNIPAMDVFFAYPKMVDVHWEDEECYEDEDDSLDDDLDEPIDY